MRAGPMVAAQLGGEGTAGGLQPPTPDAPAGGQAASTLPADQVTRATLAPGGGHAPSAHSSGRPARRLPRVRVRVHACACARVCACVPAPGGLLRNAARASPQKRPRPRQGARGPAGATPAALPRAPRTAPRAPRRRSRFTSPLDRAQGLGTRTWSWLSPGNRPGGRVTRRWARLCPWATRSSTRSRERASAPEQGRRRPSPEGRSCPDPKRCREGEEGAVCSVRPGAEGVAGAGWKPGYPHGLPACGRALAAGLFTDVSLDAAHGPSPETALLVLGIKRPCLAVEGLAAAPSPRGPSWSTGPDRHGEGGC